MKRIRLSLRFFALIVVFVSCVLNASAVNASDITAFGPKKYVRTTGAPNIYTDDFSARPGEARLVILNGLKGEKSNSDMRVTSGVVSLNGEVLFTHDDFKHQTYTLEIPITLAENNTIRVELESKPGSFLSIEIIQTVPEPVYDLQASDLQVNAESCPDSVDLGLRLTNTSEDLIPAGVKIAFYNGNPEAGGSLIGTSESTTELQPAGIENISFQWANPSAEQAVIYARVDDDGTGTGTYEEMDEENNLLMLDASLCRIQPGKSSLSGHLIDAVNGDLLSGVHVLLHLNENGTPGTVVASTESDNGGIFTFSNLPIGTYIISAARDGYIENQRSVTLADNVQLTNQDIVLSPVLAENEIRIILTWNAQPPDLEAHLTVPSEEGCRYHCYYFDKTIPMASLDLDDRNGYGPETITITDRVSGTYRYYVHDFTNRYSNSLWLARSGAVVKVFYGDREPMVFTVPYGYGNVWHVFDLEGDTGEITPVHTMSNQSEPGKIDYPTITSGAPGTAYWGSPYSYQVRATDPDKDPLTYSLTQAPTGMTIDPQTGLIQWTPAGNQMGYYWVTVQVDDGRCGEATQTYRVNVNSYPSINFSVSPCSGFNPGGDITLTWSTTRATTVLIDQGIGEVAASGTLTIPSPAEPIPYTLTAFNDAALIKRVVPGYPAASFYFSPRYIYAGDSTTLYWNPQCSTSSVIDHGIGEVSSAGSMKITPTASATYYLNLANGAATNRYGAWFYIMPPPSPPPPSANFSISPLCNLTPGDPKTLSWSTSNATSVSISPDIGTVEPSGSIKVYPTKAGSYTLTATGAGGTIYRTVYYPNSPGLNFYSSAYGIDLGNPVTLHWSSSCADTVTMNQGVGELSPSGSMTVTPKTLPMTYTVTAANERGPVSRSVYLYQIAPTAKLTADPAIMKVGDSTTLSWSSSRASSCSISPSIGPVALNGSMVITPTTPTTYRLTAQGPGGTASYSVGVGFVYPMADLKASALTINQGETVKLTWIYANATKSVINQGIGEVELGGERTVAPTSTTTYSMTATGPGGTVTDSVTVKVVPTGQPPIVSISASPATILPGNPAILTWDSSYTDTLTIEPGIGTVANSGSVTVTPATTTSYTATATGPGGTIIKNTIVTVVQPSPAMTLTAEPKSIMAGESTVLSWTSSNVDTITFDQGIGEMPPQGSVTVTPNATTLYTAKAVGPGGTISRSVSVNVSHPTPTVTFSASPQAIRQGDSTTLNWSTENAQTVTIWPGIGTVAASGTKTISPAKDTTYILTVTGITDTTTRSLAVDVYPVLDLQVDTPTDGSTVADPNITVSGRISAGAHVEVNGVPATVNGTAFTAPTVLDPPGQHTITVKAADDYGQEKTVQLSITYLPELRLEVAEPAQNTFVYSSPIQVSGTVTNNADVTVNAIAATVAGDTFSASLPLTMEGPQTLLIEARDSYGQQKSMTIEVSYFRIPVVTLTADRYRITGGDSVTLSWVSENCESAGLHPGVGTVDCNGSITLSPTETTKFVLQVTGLGKTARAEAVIVVDDPYGDPTAEEQAHLEAINRARANPLSEAARLQIDLNEGPPSEIIGDSPVPPLTFNKKLTRAARGHSQDMADNDYLAHEGSDGSSPQERCQAEGYEGSVGENCAAQPANFPLDSYQNSLRLHDALFIDKDYPGRGHRVNMLLSQYTEVGIGYIHESNTPDFEYGGVVTCNFGNHSIGKASVLGVVYEDVDADQSYDAGEGVPYALIHDLTSGIKVYSASAGGYSLPMADGEHTIQVTLPDGRMLIRQILVDGANIKFDFRVAMFADTKPTVQLTSLDQAIQAGQTTQLIWQSFQAEYALIDNGIGYLPANGSVTVAPTETTTYIITATGKDGNVATATATVYISDFSVPPAISSVTASPATVIQGQTTTLSWTTSNAQHVYIDNGIGDVVLNGSVLLTPEHSTTYTITVTSQGGVANAKIRVFVTGNPALQPAGSFGALYNNQIPADATVESYDPERFSLATGEVKSLSGNPLAGVAITILDHPEYGTVATDAEGKFILPVEGGTTLTLIYNRDNYLPAQRQVYVPVNDIGIAKTVQLLQQDTRATEVKLDGNPGTVITHRSSLVTDGSGARSLTMIFQGDNRAFAVDENGKNVRELKSFTTRATEYKTSASMPAELPKTSAYTYCAELQIDGVDRVRFSKPVVTWVDNFLGFEVGTAVPVGYYDRDKGIWVASRNGIVVTLLDTNGDGVVDGVDKDGDGQPDDLNGNGNIEDEAMGLGDAQVYAPGASFWRMELDHFSPLDFNWPIYYYYLLQMMGVNVAELLEQLCPDCPKSSTGSSVGNESRIFYENIDIPGTSLSLAYASDRTEGYKQVVSVPVSGEIVIPSMVKRIDVEMDIAGRKFKKSLDPLPNQVTEFVWDGRDLLNNRVLHNVTAHVNIGYVYDSYYMNSGWVKTGFGQFGTTTTEVPARNEVTNWRRSELQINPAEKGHGLAQGWSISAHHKLSPTDPTTLHKGDGSVVRNNTAFIATIAGTGEEGWAADGAIARETPISTPVSTALDAEGNIYVANQIHAAIIKINKAGLVEVVAGGFSGSKEEDNIDAKEARIHVPNDLAFDSRGNLFIADAGINKIRKIDTNGIITTIAGNGNQESSGDDGPALLAGIMPSSIAVDDAGSIYFAEATTCVGGEIDPVTGQCTGGEIVESSYRVRKISTDGMVLTIAGTGEQFNPSIHVNNGDGGPADKAYLSGPTSVSVDRDGNLYIADGTRIRKVNPSGTITTVAGNGTSGYSGDGGLATTAQITHAGGITFDNRGNFYFSQYYGNGDVIRKVGSDGYISTVAGKGEPGMAGDDGAATRALLMQPHRLSIDARGFIIIPDRGNRLIRKVSVKSYDQQETYFTEVNGLGHLISAEGYHSLTYDLETGLPLLEFGYDVNGRLTSIIDQFGNVVTIERVLGVATAIVSPDGLRTELTIDEYNQLKELAYPDGNAFTFAYQDNDGLLTAKTEPNGNRFDHFFDETGRVYKTTNLEQGVWQFTREATAEGLVTSTITTPNTSSSVERYTKSTGAVESTGTTVSGEVITSNTSADGLDSTSQSSCGPKVESSSDLDYWFDHTYVKSTTVTTPAGLSLATSIDKAYVDSNEDGLFESVTQTVTVNNKIATIKHDVVNAAHTITSPEGRRITTNYDPDTLQTLSTTVPGLLKTEFGYRTDGKLLSVISGTRTTGYSYDSAGNVATITDPLNRVTRFSEYDAVGRLVKMERADSSVLQYNYDENGNMTLYRTAYPADNAFDYNGVNNRSSFSTPLGSTTSYSYNEERQLTRVTLPSTKAIVNSYVSGKLKETATPEWTNIYEYHCGDLVGSITRGAEKVDYSYDGDLLTAIAQSGTVTGSLGFSYNNDFQLASFTYAGATAELGYDKDGLLLSSGGFTIGRNSDNGLPETVFANSFSLSRTFNDYGEVDGVGIDVAGAVFGYDLTRDTTGRIKSKTETIAGADSLFTYTYDPLGRLRTVTKDGNLVEEYRYDNNGNRSYQMNAHLNIADRTFSHSLEDHTLTAGPVTYEFDYDDNLSARIEGAETTRYVYSTTGELQRVTLPDTTVISYVHDPLGRRIAKKINGSTVEKYLWSGQTTLLAVYDGNDNLLQRFEYADGRMPVAMTAGGSTYYLAYDQVGSLRLVTDSGGKIVKRIDYDSFGNILTDSNENFTIPFGFAGGLHDRDTGLVRFGYRDFLPEIGKWTAKDPILFAGGDSNLYVYVANDPVNWVDPEGLSFNGGLGYGGTIVIGWGDFCFGGSLSFSFNVADDGSFAAQVNIIKFDKVYGGYAGIGRSINGGLSIDNPNTGINSYHDQPAVATGAGRGPSGEVSVVLGQDDNGGGFIGAAGSGRAGQGYGAYYGEGKAMGVEVRGKLWE